MAKVVRAVKPEEVKKAVSEKKQTAAEKLDTIGIDAICARIVGDESQRAIADSLGVLPSALSEWLSSDIERSARAREARAASAALCDDKALEALMQIPDSGTNAEVARQREIASHYRWRAKTRNPKDYGDALKVDADVTTRNLTPEQVDAQIARLTAKLNGAD